ncbi:MAG: hypothetical protein PVH31_10800 [Ectothiorhodospiraceae bacterium]|jgi:hypothetical protein
MSLPSTIPQYRNVSPEEINHLILRGRRLRSQAIARSIRQAGRSAKAVLARVAQRADLPRDALTR